MNSAVITILSLSVSGSILALILLAGKPLLKSRVSKAFSYYVWLLIMLRLIMPVAAPVNIMGTLFDIEQLPANSAPTEQIDNQVERTDQIGAPSNTQAVLQERQNNEAVTTQKPVDIQWPLEIWNFIKNNLLWIWLAGAVASLGWFITAYICFSRRIRRSCVTPHSDDLAVFEQIRGGRRIKMACSSLVSTPVLIGAFHPVIVLPQLAYVRNGMDAELKHILRHELTHYRRKDVLYKWLVATVTSLHWFNPLMLWIRREIGRACELSCDEAVISGMSESEKQFYGNTLLTLSADRKLPAGILTTTLCEEKEQLAERLVSIKRYKKKSTFAISFALMLLLTDCAVTLGAATGSNGTIMPVSSTKTENIQIAAPFEYIAAELLKTCEFPIYLPTYFPAPAEGNEWTLSSNVKNDTFSIEMNRQPLGYTGQAHSLADWYGVLSGNVGEPSEQPLEKQFKSGDGNITVNEISLPDGIKGKEYVDDPKVAGSTAIAWEKDGWSFFVTAYPDGDSSTSNYANRIIGAIKDSGQALPGSQGKLCFIYNGNMSMTEVSWEVEPGVWYGIDSRDPNDVIKLLQSMKKLDGGKDPPLVSGSDSIDNASPADGEVWLVQREGYEVGLRNQGDQTEILLRRDGAATVFDSVPSNSDTGMRYSLRSFDAIPELSGFVLENLTSYGWGNFYYYAVQDNSAVCFAQSFGGDMTDAAEDLDGDGTAELICNVTYNADGVTDVLVYRMRAGIPQAASVKDAMLDVPGDKHLARPASAAYDVNTGYVTLEYLIAGENDSHVETAPIDYDSLQFEDFTATW